MVKTYYNLSYNLLTLQWDYAFGKTVFGLKSSTILFGGRMGENIKFNFMICLKKYIYLFISRLQIEFQLPL